MRNRIVHPVLPETFIAPATDVTRARGLKGRLRSPGRHPTTTQRRAVLVGGLLLAAGVLTQLWGCGHDGDAEFASQTPPPRATTSTTTSTVYTEPTIVAPGEGPTLLEPVVLEPPPSGHPPTSSVSPVEVALSADALFDFDSAALHEERRAELEAAVAPMVAAALADRAVRVLVVGQSDARGDAAYNVGLSRRRAATVAGVLVGLGVDANQIVARGCGEGCLLPEVDPFDGANRRVEVSVEVDP